MRSLSGLGTLGIVLTGFSCLAGQLGLLLSLSASYVTTYFPVSPRLVIPPGLTRGYLCVHTYLLLPKYVPTYR